MALLQHVPNNTIMLKQLLPFKTIMLKQLLFFRVGFPFPIHGRKLEDKLLNHKIELRPWTLNLNLCDLHKNRVLPGAFMCYLGVADSTLPMRGVAHRSVRGAPEAEAQTNASLVPRYYSFKFPNKIPSRKAMDLFATHLVMKEYESIDLVLVL